MHLAVEISYLNDAVLYFSWTKNASFLACAASEYTQNTRKAGPFHPLTFFIRAKLPLLRLHLLYQDADMSSSVRFTTFLDKATAASSTKSVSFLRTFFNCMFLHNYKQPDCIGRWNLCYKEQEPRLKRDVKKFLSQAPTADPVIKEQTISLTRVTRKRKTQVLVFKKGPGAATGSRREVELEVVESETPAQPKRLRTAVLVCTNHTASAAARRKPKRILSKASSQMHIQAESQDRLTTCKERNF